MGKFFNEEVEPQKDNTVIKYIIIGVGAAIVIGLIIALIVITNKNKPVIKKDGETIGVGEEYPDPKVFFENINEKLNITADYSKCDNTKVGDCKVTISGDIKNITTTLHIVDRIPPELVLKEKLEINVGDKYSPEDFVESCTDNLSESCNIRFYENAKDDEGNMIDYSRYTKEGNYKVKIFALDEYNNASDVVEVELIIGGGSEVACEFGSMNVDTEKYGFPISVETKDGECPVDRNLYNEPDMRKEADLIYNANYESLKTDMNDILRKEFPKGANITVCPQYFPIFNKENKGLVGYSIYVKVLIDTEKKLECTDEGTEEYVVMSYYIQKDGSRLYDKNNYQA